LAGQQQSNNLFANLEYDEETKEITKDSAVEMIVLLQRLVQNEEFIRIIPSSRRSSTSSTTTSTTRSSLYLTPSVRDMNVNENALIEDAEVTTNTFTGNGVDENSVKFREFDTVLMDFRVDVERQTIYDLMLDDQKESLHDRVASYLETENSKKKAKPTGKVKFQYLMPISPSDYIEEGFHWEKAKIWGNAMICYYEAAMQLDRLGAYQESYEYLSLAYQMLLGLRRIGSMKETFPTMSFHTLIHILQSHGIQVDSFAMFKTFTVADMKRKYTENSVTSSGEEATYISKIDIY